MSDSIDISVVIITYNNQDDISDCLKSVTSQTIGNYEVIIVDNGSDDSTVDIVKSNFPDVKIIENRINRWYTGGNNDGFRIANGAYIVVLNPDTVVEKDWLDKLVQPLRSGHADASTSKIARYENPDRLNTCGLSVHYTGLGFCRGLDEPITSYDARSSVPALSGCCFGITRNALESVGEFDESFEFYLEDLDLSWRLRLLGYELEYVPDSLVYHKYDRSFPVWRFYNMERNRFQILLKSLQKRTICKLFPALVLTDLLTFGLAVLKGPQYILAKIRAYRWIIQNRDSICSKRQSLQKQRSISDSQLLEPFTDEIPFGRFGVPPVIERVLNSFTSAIYPIVRDFAIRYDDVTDFRDKFF
jgi:GT2 family glycosyltransferase